MRLDLYSFLFAAAHLSLLTTLSNAFYADDTLEDMFRRDSGLNVLPDHYLRSFDESPLADISTRELVYELESRLERREKGATGTGNTGSTSVKKDAAKGDAAGGQNGPDRKLTVEQLNKSLKRVVASTKKHAKEAAEAIRQMIKSSGGVPYDEGAGGKKGGAAQAGGVQGAAGANTGANGAQGAGGAGSGGKGATGGKKTP